jgi:glycosyltransferase involved in cell wall biosynthesis
VSRRILYLQFTNPAGYPPLLHSASILAERGWEVLLVGAPVGGAASFALPEHERIRSIETRSLGNSQQTTGRYALFAAQCLHAARRFRPDWCYASDASSAPVALVMGRLLRVRLLYHEHDAPGENVRGAVLRARAAVAARAEIVVAPSAQRLEQIPEGRARRLVVWNCPRRSEIAGEVPARDADEPFRLVYHGSLSRDRLTPEFVGALAMLPPRVELDIFGYETAGHRGYVPELLERARSAGVSERIRYHGPIAARAELLRRLHGFHLGISTVVPGTDPNLDTLAGASNKAFEYLGLGIPLLISRVPEWQRMYEAPGYAVSCNADDAASIAAAVREVMEDPARARRMGEAGRARVRDEWNYETQFAPVLELLSA